MKNDSKFQEEAPLRLHSQCNGRVGVHGITKGLLGYSPSFQKLMEGMIEGTPNVIVCTYDNLGFSERPRKKKSWNCFITQTAQS